MVTAEQLKAALTIKSGRERAAFQDTCNFQAKRQKFLEWFSNVNFLPNECERVKKKYGQGYNVFLTKSPVMTFEMYPQSEDDPVKSKPEIYQNFNQWHNTRVKIPSETCWETDKLEFEKALQVCYEIVLALMDRNIHFAVFYAEGQRSPHIRIYDWNSLQELSSFQREKAQAKFWRSIAPFFFQYADAGMWADEHYYCLEFAPHWKYGSIFDLWCEYLPQEEKCRN